jgi:flagellar biosynthesis protein FlhG
MDDEIRNKMWAIGGGKGGVGKSVATVMLGTSLARLGRKVILVDADLGGSNLHTFTGVRYPEYTLADFINKKVDSIEKLVLDTPVENLKIICGADDILGVANPKYAQKTRLFTHLKKLQADIILLDLGAGSSFTTVDFFLYAPNKIVVLTPQVTSIQNAYGFIKASLYRSLNEAFSKNAEAMELIKRGSYSVQGESIDSIAKLYDAFQPLGEESQELLMNCIEKINIKLIVNMLKEPKEKNVGEIVQSVAKNYLSLDLEIIGTVQYDNVLNASINKMSSFLVNGKESVANSNFFNIAYNILKKVNVPARVAPIPAYSDGYGSPSPM